jgi:hypothetical protein
MMQHFSDHSIKQRIETLYHGALRDIVLGK